MYLVQINLVIDIFNYTTTIITLGYTDSYSTLIHWLINLKPSKFFFFNEFEISQVF